MAMLSLIDQSAEKKSLEEKASAGGSCRLQIANRPSGAPRRVLASRAERQSSQQTPSEER
jgi:hypothetical protein